MNLTPEQLTEQTIAAFAAWKKDPKTLLEYQRTTGEWTPSTGTMWNLFHYRIKPFELGREVNGHSLGEGEQWHRVDGWTPEMLPAPYRPLIAGNGDVEYEYSWDGQIFKPQNTKSGKDIPGDRNNIFWRTKRPLPSALKPKFRDWNCAEDVPMPICWLQSGGEKDRVYQVNYVCSKGVWTPNGAGNQLWPWARFSERGHNAVNYSTDGATWQPCKTEVK